MIQRILRCVQVFLWAAWFLLFAGPASAADETPIFPKVHVQDGKLFAGGEELFLNAIGYSGLRPGRDHTDSLQDPLFGYEFIEADMQRIKECGFNAIRTYALLDKNLVEIAGKHNLWVIAGIWTDQNINLADPAQVAAAKKTVLEQTKIYASYPNVAMIFLINEPNPGIMSSPDAAQYLKDLAKTAEENSGGIPISFANMSNTAFIDPKPWDVVSCNIYAQVYPAFNRAIGYRGYVEGVRKLSADAKPFFISEYGFYAPVPNPNPKEMWIDFAVKDEDEQTRNLLRDQATLLPLNLVGASLMMWNDDWRVFGEVPEAQQYLEDPVNNKYIHDQFTQEWGGIVAFDEDPQKGILRPAYAQLQKANQALPVSLDPEKIYTADIPVRLFVTENVSKIMLSLDGKESQPINKVSAHWFETKVPFTSDKKSLKLVKHDLKFRVYDAQDKMLNEFSRVVWEGKADIKPVLKVRKVSTGFVPEFEIILVDSAGKPLAGQTIDWGLFDIFNWKAFSGQVKTDEKGKAKFSAPEYASFLVGVGYVFQKDGFRTRVSDLILSR